MSDLQDRSESFFQARVKDRMRFRVGAPPQSAYMTKDLRSRLQSRGFYPNVVWMWNPRYHTVTLKTRVVYEAYPESQDEVDALVKRSYGARVKASFCTIPDQSDCGPLNRVAAIRADTRP